MEITDVTTIDQLSDAEVDELLARALNPRTPIEIFYAVLDRIGGIPAAAADPAPLPEEEPALVPAAPELEADLGLEPVPAEVGASV
ncbi:MAG TPA: hypothetical protein VFN97_27700 [Actinospica sp.]|nr:hypothetical protein [Actinospica sp.]